MIYTLSVKRTLNAAQTVGSTTTNFSFKQHAVGVLPRASDNVYAPAKLKEYLEQVLLATDGVLTYSVLTPAPWSVTSYTNRFKQMTNVNDNKTNITVASGSTNNYKVNITATFKEISSTSVPKYYSTSIVYNDNLSGLATTLINRIKNDTTECEARVLVSLVVEFLSNHESS